MLGHYMLISLFFMLSLVWQTAYKFGNFELTYLESLSAQFEAESNELYCFPNFVCWQIFVSKKAGKINPKS
jgi:hypothetical protein